MSQSKLSINDLRIGNWVFYHWDVPKYTDRADHTELNVGQISDIITTTDEHQVKIKGHGFPIDLDDCKPIPISHSLLEMAGFEAEEKRRWLFNKDGLTCHPGGWIKGYGDRTRLRFQYVHELQNIFHIMRGWELEFNGIVNILDT